MQGTIKKQSLYCFWEIQECSHLVESETWSIWQMPVKLMNCCWLVGLQWWVIWSSNEHAVLVLPAKVWALLCGSELIDFLV